MHAPAALNAASQLVTLSSAGPLIAIALDDGQLVLRDDSTGVLSGIAPVWAFAVSGYRLLPR